MEVVLSPDRARFVRCLVGEGRFASPSLAVETALGLLEASVTACPRRQAVARGLEGVLAGRSAAFTVDETIRRAARRAAPP